MTKYLWEFRDLQVKPRSREPEETVRRGTAGLYPTFVFRYGMPWKHASSLPEPCVEAPKKRLPSPGAGMSIKVSWLAVRGSLTPGSLSDSLPNLPVSGCNIGKLPLTVTG
jgi:hypothetical protein